MQAMWALNRVALVQVNMDFPFSCSRLVGVSKSRTAWMATDALGSKASLVLLLFLSTSMAFSKWRYELGFGTKRLQGVKVLFPKARLSEARLYMAIDSKYHKLDFDCGRMTVVIPVGLDFGALNVPSSINRSPSFLRGSSKMRWISCLYFTSASNGLSP